MNFKESIPYKLIITGAAIGLLLLLIWISLFTGIKDISFASLFSDKEQALFFIISRIPRTLALLFVGAGLSLAGFVFQHLSQNKFVSPTTAGTLEAAKMGILFSIIFIPEVPLMMKMSFAMLFTFLASLLFIGFISKVNIKNTIYIPLVGLMFGNILSAISTFFAYKHGIVQNTQEWMLGDFSSVLQGQYETVFLILPAVVLIYFYADRITIAGLGPSFAKNLGLPYYSIVYMGLFIIALVVSSSVVTVGAIPFIGLIVPNLLSLIYGDNLRRTLPIIAYTGASFLLFCDILSRLLVYPFEVPIGMTVGIIGGILFLVLILRRKK
ncbi:ABC transporter permease [Sphingobacterium humi]|uniref:ABC transporter permease n=1 Tax=Sphingobacterium humi TaxID=1796905 RepID=UPI001BB09A34|nr:iron chelate uptake ABC transporter family permease subunit [Sphingobacterium humi]